MNSGMIGKIEKAHRYAQEPQRIEVNQLSATFRGSHDSYLVTLNGDQWTCSCHTFESHMVGACSHVMAMQLVLAPMLSNDAKYAVQGEPALH